MKREKEIAKVKFREFLHVHNATDDDIDMDVDGTNCYMAVCFGDIRLTPEAEAEFGECLDKLRVEGTCVVSDNDEDYDLIDEDEGLLNFSLAALGYIPPQTDEELQAFEELHKDYIPRIKDWHVDVDKIINGEIKCE